MPTKVKKLGQGRENAKIYLEKNPQVAAEIEMAVRTKAGVIAKKMRAILQRKILLLKKILKKIVKKINKKPSKTNKGV